MKIQSSDTQDTNESLQADNGGTDYTLSPKDGQPAEPAYQANFFTKGANTTIDFARTGTLLCATANLSHIPYI